MRITMGTLSPLKYSLLVVGLLFAALCVFSISTESVSAFTNSCYVSATYTCSFGDFPLFSLFDGPVGGDTTHIAAYNSSIPYQLCCNYNATLTPYFTTGFCAQGTWLSAFTLWNTHIAQNKTDGTSAAYNLCAPSGDGYSYCTYNYGNTSCAGTQTCIVSIDSSLPGNSHFGACGAMGVNICCSFNQTITLPGVQIAQFDYWCGAADGVCPEKFSNSTGGKVSCATRPDPDC